MVTIHSPISSSTRGWFIPLSLFACIGVAPAQTPVFINEIHYDNVNTDVDEAIEVAGPAGTNLAGWRIELYNGAGGATYGTSLPLSGTIPDQCGGYGTIAIVLPVNGLQNGSPDGLALINASSAVVQFLSYEGSFVATSGAAIGLPSVDIGVLEVATTPVGESLQLIGAGTDYEDFTWSGPFADTRGACNTGQVFCAAAVTNSYGTGNAHSIHGVATLVTTSPPVPGSNGVLSFQYASPDPDPITLMLGIAAQDPPLVLLDARLYIDVIQPTFTVPFGTNAGGATLSIPIAADQALCTGTSFYLQALLLDLSNPGTAFGLVCTNGVEWIIGS